MRCLTAQEILALHDLLIEASGGSHGIRDTGLLQSAAARPKTQIGGNDAFPGVFEKAAAYFDSLAHHHVFIDGNKRTAFETAAAFLFFNGYELQATNKEVVSFVLRAVSKKLEIPEIAAWLKQYSKRMREN